MNAPTQSPVARFDTTRWSLVLRAGKSGTDETRVALNDLISRYWYPLYAFARRLGNSHHDGMDLTQGFITHLIEGDALSTVSPNKGRFRSFLLAAFKNFIANEHRNGKTQRRGGQVQTISLHDQDFRSRYNVEPATNETPEVLFDRTWCDELLHIARLQLAEEYRQADKTILFELLEPHLASSTSALPRTEICQRLNLSSAALAMSLHRMRRRFSDLLRQSVAETLDDPTQVDDELHLLISTAEFTGR